MNPLIDVIPATARKYVYAVVALALYVYSVWRATQGDWEQFGVTLAGALASTLAHANVTVAPKADGILVVGPTDPNALALDPTPIANPAAVAPAPAPVAPPVAPVVPADVVPPTV